MVRLAQSGHGGTLDHLFVRETLNALVVWEAFHRKCSRKSRSGYLPLNPMVCRFCIDSDGAGS